jgi:hypothetical protein
MEPNPIVLVAKIMRHERIPSATMDTRTSLVTWWSELLTTNHEDLVSIPGSAAGIFPCREDPHSDHALGSL